MLLIKMSISIVVSVLIVFIIAIIIDICKQYTLIRVNGKSMYPTLKHGQFYILDRLYKDITVGKIYVIQEPTSGRPCIKRLKLRKLDGLRGGYFLWFEGDNAFSSYDSRDYGFLTERDIIGKVLTNK